MLLSSPSVTTDLWASRSAFSCIRLESLNILSKIQIRPESKKVAKKIKHGNEKSKIQHMRLPVSEK